MRKIETNPTEPQPTLSQKVSSFQVVKKPDTTTHVLLLLVKTDTVRESALSTCLGNPLYLNLSTFKTGKLSQEGKQSEHKI